VDLLTNYSNFYFIRKLNNLHKFLLRLQNSLNRTELIFILESIKENAKYISQLSYRSQLSLRSGLRYPLLEGASYGLWLS